jgi:hypothetical protein
MGASIYLGKVLSAGTKGCNIIVPTTAPFTGLLDTYPNAAAAYSLRKLRSAYSGSAIRVRRSSDNAEQNIGFVNNVLDTASLLTFCGAGNGFVTTWYDQSGNSYNVINSSAIGQPQIVSSGVVITKNSKPTTNFTTSNELLSPLNFNLSFFNASMFAIIQGNTGATEVLPFGFGKALNVARIRSMYKPLNNSFSFAGWGADYASSINFASDTQINQYSIINTGTTPASPRGITMYKNSTSESGNTNADLLQVDNGSFIINGLSGYNFRGNMHFSEGIFYTTNKTPDASGIQLNQKTFYGTP